MKDHIDIELPIIFIDLDDTVADFKKSAESILERELAIECRDITDEEWKKIEKYKNFYSDMDLKDGALELVNEASNHNNTVAFLGSISSKVDYDWAVRTKNQWLDKHFKNFDRYFVRSSNHKRFFCYDGNILIDDKQYIIKDWNDSGGIGILLRDCHVAKIELQKHLTIV